MLDRLIEDNPPHVRVQPWLSDGFDGMLPQDVDAIHSMITLLHHSWVDGAELMRQLLLSLRPGGVAGVNLPLYDTPTQSADWTGVTTWTEAMLHEAVEGLGIVLSTRVSAGAFRLGAVGIHHGAYQWLRRV
jgi:hypothetical protein